MDRITLMGNGANVTLEGSLGRDDIIYLAAGATNWDTAKIAETFGIEQTQIGLRKTPLKISLRNSPEKSPT